MVYEIKQGYIEGRYFTMVTYEEKEISKPLKIGLDRFFEKYKAHKLSQRRLEESEHGYINMS